MPLNKRYKFEKASTFAIRLYAELYLGIDEEQAVVSRDRSLPDVFQQSISMVDSTTLAR